MTAIQTDRQTRQVLGTDTQLNDYCNPRCACAPRVNNNVRGRPAGRRRRRNFFLGVVEQLYRMRDRGILAAWRKLNRMRDCVVLMKKVVTVLLPLASVLLLVAAQVERACEATMRRLREMKLPPDTVTKLSESS